MRARPATAETVLAERNMFFVCALICVPIVAAAIVFSLMGSPLLSFLLTGPAVVAVLVLIAFFAGWRDEVRKLNGHEPRRGDVRPQMPTRPGRGRLTPGQYRYVMRHSTNFRIGNRRGRRPF